MAKFQRADIRKIVGENCTEEIENALMALHHSVLDPLLDDLQKAKESADKLPDVQKKLDEYKSAEKSGEDYKAKYEALVKENAEKAEKGRKTDALRTLLKDIGISEKRLDAVLKVSDIGSLKLDKDGAIEGAEDLKGKLKTEWADFITTAEKHSAGTATPPVSGAVKTYKDKAEILAIRDTAERQKAIAENHELFGI